MISPVPYRPDPSISERDAVRIWEDSVGDSGDAPTDAELTAFANAVLLAHRSGIAWGW
jgi:hypothetical protein